MIPPTGMSSQANTAPQKVGLFSKFSSLFNGKSTAVEATSLTPDEVQFRGVAPEMITPGEYFIVKIMMYQEITGRDLFYLFWSQNAAASEWVQKELQYALSQKTEDYIESIPLEAPDLCPPPPSLSGKHFNDWTLRYLNNQ